jgi:2Fe-2S ferredoxin
MAKINCPQLNRVFEYDPKLSVMDNLLKKGIPVASSCGGDGICGKCRMKVFTPDELPAASDLEKNTLKKNNAEAGERLSCQLFLKGNAMLETTYW